MDRKKELKKRTEETIKIITEKKISINALIILIFILLLSLGMSTVSFFLNDNTMRMAKEYCYENAIYPEGKSAIWGEPNGSFTCDGGYEIDCSWFYETTASSPLPGIFAMAFIAQVVAIISFLCYSERKVTNR